MRIRLATLVLTAPFWSGCGGGGSSTDAGGQGTPPPGEEAGETSPGDEAPTGETPEAPLPPADEPRDCAALWQSYVDARPVGTVAAYETQVTTVGPEGLAGQFLTSYRYTVESASEDAVTTKVVTTELLPAEDRMAESSETLTREDFVTSCEESYGIRLPDADHTITVTDRGAESVTVPAGTFATNWLAYQIDWSGADDEYRAVNKLWKLDDGSDFAVLWTSESTRTVGAAEFKTTLRSELVELVRP